jgi:two-component system, sensor histidine kinase YesM
MPFKRKTFNVLSGHNLRLQYKLGLYFFVFFLLPTIIFGFMLILSFTRILEKNHFQHQNISIKQLQNDIDKNLISLHKISRDLSYNIPFSIKLSAKSTDFDTEDELLKHKEEIKDEIGKLVKGNSSIIDYFILKDLEEIYVSGSDDNQPSANQLITDKNFFRLTDGTPRIMLYKPSFLSSEHSESGEFLIFASRITITNLPEKTMKNGVLLLLVNRRYIDSIIYRYDRFADQIFLFSSDGEHIYSDNRIITHKILPSKLASSIRADRTGSHKLREGDITNLISHSASRFNSIILLSFTSNERIKSDIEFLNRFTLWFTMLLISIVAVFIIYFSRSISNPINQIENIMKKLDKSNYNDTSVLTGTRFRGVLSPYFKHLLDFLLNILTEINNYHIKEKEHELMILQAQINPHFMYNSLNTIRIMAELDGQDKISEASRALIKLLKKSIRVGVIFISIRDEIDQIRDYIFLQQMRYDNSFTMEYDIDSRTLNYRCIKFILQPIIENSIFHGMDHIGRTGKINVAIRLRGSYIYYTVKDNGKGFDTSILQTNRQNIIAQENALKIGLSNVNSRLEKYFGKLSKLKIESSIGEGTTVSYKIPAEKYE